MLAKDREDWARQQLAADNDPNPQLPPVPSGQPPPLTAIHGGLLIASEDMILALIGRTGGADGCGWQLGDDPAAAAAAAVGSGDVAEAALAAAIAAAMSGDGADNTAAGSGDVDVEAQDSKPLLGRDSQRSSGSGPGGGAGGRGGAAGAGVIKTRRGRKWRYLSAGGGGGDGGGGGGGSSDGEGVTGSAGDGAGPGSGGGGGGGGGGLTWTGSALELAKCLGLGLRRGGGGGDGAAGSSSTAGGNGAAGSSSSASSSKPPNGGAAAGCPTNGKHHASDTEPTQGRGCGAAACTSGSGATAAFDAGFGGSSSGSHDAPAVYRYWAPAAEQRCFGQALRRRQRRHTAAVAAALEGLGAALPPGFTVMDNRAYDASLSQRPSSFEAAATAADSNAAATAAAGATAGDGSSRGGGEGAHTRLNSDRDGRGSDGDDLDEMLAAAAEAAAEAAEAADPERPWTGWQQQPLVVGRCSARLRQLLKVCVCVYVCMREGGFNLNQSRRETVALQGEIAGGGGRAARGRAGSGHGSGCL
mgnify:CR=1 FL=1